MRCAESRARRARVPAPARPLASRAEDGEDGGELAGGKRGAGEDNDYEAKRRKRLELNRKAAQESRRRKKLRIEELQRSVVFLTRENNELREQNELLRQMLAAEMPTESTSAIDRFQAENAALKLALYESVQNLAKQKTIAGIPLAAAGAAAAGLPGAATSGAAASTAMAAAMAAVSSAGGTLTAAGEPGQQAALLSGLAPGAVAGQGHQGHGLSLLANQARAKRPRRARALSLDVARG